MSILESSLKMFKTTALTIAGLALLGGGCGDDFFDPTQIGRFRPVPVVNVILDTLGVAEETPSTWANAEEPRPIDSRLIETDLRLGPGDAVRISIYELRVATMPFMQDYIVTETGKISIPDVGIVEAAGLTEAQLEEEIRKSLSPTILKEPIVSVLLLDSQQRAYSISGNAVPAAGRYNIPRYDFRLLDALATARVETQFNVSYVYVSRIITGEESLAEPGMEGMRGRTIEPGEEMLEIIAPRAQRRLQNELVITSAEMATYEELERAAMPEGLEPLSDESQELVEEILPKEQRPPAERGPSRETIEEPFAEPGDDGQIQWQLKDDEWVPVRVGPEQPETEPDRKVDTRRFRAEGAPRTLPEQLPAEYDWEQGANGAVQTRLIKIPTDKLVSGDPRYNIVVRAGDNIQIPLDLIGEFTVHGNVNGTGYIPITGRPMTLKQAIAAAGGLGPLAWPTRVEVVRRIGKDKEMTVMVDLDKIARGEQPDFFIKPNDWINVGSHPAARWLAVLRNSFRATYGFGFIYDRNFADRDFGTSRPIPNWF
jgi:polysaccharide export outer membrane protein